MTELGNYQIFEYDDVDNYIEYQPDKYLISDELSDTANDILSQYPPLDTLKDQLLINVILPQIPYDDLIILCSYDKKLSSLYVNDQIWKLKTQRDFPSYYDIKQLGNITWFSFYQELIDGFKWIVIYPEYKFTRDSLYHKLLPEFSDIQAIDVKVKDKLQLTNKQEELYPSYDPYSSVYSNPWSSDAQTYSNNIIKQNNEIMIRDQKLNGTFNKNDFSDANKLVVDQIINLSDKNLAFNLQKIKNSELFQYPIKLKNDNLKKEEYHNTIVNLVVPPTESERVQLLKVRTINSNFVNSKSIDVQSLEHVREEVHDRIVKSIIEFVTQSYSKSNQQYVLLLVDEYKNPMGIISVYLDNYNMILFDGYVLDQVLFIIIVTEPLKVDYYNEMSSKYEDDKFMSKFIINE